MAVPSSEADLSSEAEPSSAADPSFVVVLGSSGFSQAPSTVGHTSVATATTSLGTVIEPSSVVVATASSLANHALVVASLWAPTRQH